MCAPIDFTSADGNVFMVCLSLASLPGMRRTLNVVKLENVPSWRRRSGPIGASLTGWLVAVAATAAAWLSLPLQCCYWMPAAGGWPMAAGRWDERDEVYTTLPAPRPSIVFHFMCLAIEKRLFVFGEKVILIIISVCDVVFCLLIFTCDTKLKIRKWKALRVNTNILGIPSYIYV